MLTSTAILMRWREGNVSGGRIVVRGQPIVPRRTSGDIAEAGCPVRSFDLWTRANVGEIMPGVVSHLGWSMMERVRNEAFRYLYRKAGLYWVDDVCFVHRFQGRVYMNMGALNRIATGLGLPSGLVLRSLGGPLPDGDRPLRQRPLRPQRVAMQIPHLLRLAVHQQLAVHDFRNFVPATAAIARRYSALDAHALSDRQLARCSLELGWALGGRLRLLLTLNTASFGTFGILVLMCEGWVGDKSLAEDLVMGLEASRTGEGSLRLMEIARQASGDPVLKRLIRGCSSGELWQTLRGQPEASRLVLALDAYLDQYGHRCAGEVDIAVPRWREDPTPIMAALKEHVVASSGSDTPDFRQTLREGWRRVEARALRQIAAWQRPLFLLALQQARSLMSLREDPKFELLKLMLPLRCFIMEMADRLVDRGLLVGPGDVFLLKDLELHRFLRAVPSPALISELQMLVEERRQERELLDAVEPPDIIGPGGQPLAGAVVATVPPTQQLRGLGASPGRVRGLARVVKTLADGDQVKSGEILVAHVMDPGWTCVFPLVSAIVTDLGGVLSHAVVVARELGVPAVVNTGSGSRRISSGDEIEVDGDQGTVTILTDGGLL